MKARAVDIRAKMLGILKKNPRGLLLAELVRKIQAALPGVQESRIRSVIWLFGKQQAKAEAKGRPPEFVQPQWGFYRIYQAGLAGIQAQIAQMDSPPAIRVELLHGNALAAPGDALVLKYAQERYGLDRHVTRMFRAHKRALPRPNAGDAKLVKGIDDLKAKRVLVVGTPDLWELDYPDLQQFGYLALSALADAPATIERVLMTIHGPGFGMDGIEAFERELAGLREAIRDGKFPPALKTVAFVERDVVQAELLETRLHEILPSGGIAVESGGIAGASRGIVRVLPHAGFTNAPTRSHVRFPRNVTVGAKASVRDVREAAEKKRVFVAMPFADEMGDLYHFGIQGGARRAGFVCERIDLLTFVGDVVGMIRRRIESAAYVVAVLTGANPNVYLEVGYAWGQGIPCILCARDKRHFKFDVQGQRHILYDSIRDLESKLTKELRGLEKERRE